VARRSIRYERLFTNVLEKLSEWGAATLRRCIWLVCNGENGSKSAVSVARKATSHTPPRPFRTVSLGSRVNKRCFGGYGLRCSSLWQPSELG
jgi:hypothetical protein